MNLVNCDIKEILKDHGNWNVSFFLDLQKSPQANGRDGTKIEQFGLSSLNIYLEKMCYFFT